MASQSTVSNGSGYRSWMEWNEELGGKNPPDTGDLLTIYKGENYQRWWDKDDREKILLKASYAHKSHFK